MNRFEVIYKDAKKGTKVTVICGTEFYLNTIANNPDYEVISCYKRVDLSKKF